MAASKKSTSKMSVAAAFNAWQRGASMLSLKKRVGVRTLRSRFATLAGSPAALKAARTAHVKARKAQVAARREA